MNRYPRNNRIGIDQDNHNQLQFLKKFFNLKYMAEQYLETGVLTFETPNGYHLMLYKKQRTILENMTTRYAVGDCIGRLIIDEANIGVQLGAFIDTLFEEKDGDKHHEIPTNPLSKPFWDVRNHDRACLY